MQSTLIFVLLGAVFVNSCYLNPSLECCDAPLAPALSCSGKLSLGALNPASLGLLQGLPLGGCGASPLSDPCLSAISPLKLRLLKYKALKLAKLGGEFIPPSLRLKLLLQGAGSC